MNPHTFPIRAFLPLPSPLVGEGQGGGDVSSTKTKNIGKDISILRAKKLRSNLTDAEKKLWYWLRCQNLQAASFRRQAPIGSYIVDFVCYEPRLIIELDGGQHASNQSYDAKRDAWLRGEGFAVLRFWNNEVIKNTGGVLETILNHITILKQPPLPNPPPQGGRE